MCAWGREGVPLSAVRWIFVTITLEKPVKCTHVIHPHAVKWMHIAPYFSIIISHVDCDVSICSEYLYLRCLMLLQEARNFIRKWSVFKKNAANATKLRLITCSECARLRLVRTFITSVNHSWLNCCIRLLPVNNAFENRLLFTSGKLKLGRYLWNAGTIGWIFARRGYVTERLLSVQKHYPHERMFQLQMPKQEQEFNTAPTALGPVHYLFTTCQGLCAHRLSCESMRLSSCRAEV